MTKRFLIVLVFSIASILAGVVFAQTAPEVLVRVQQIGSLHPRGILYEPTYDRFAWVDTGGRLVLVDAKTYQTQVVLYKSGAYNQYRFSQDGRWLAVALERRADIWDTTTGQLSVTFSPESTLGVEGPLWFSDDGGLLVFNSRVPTPQSLRRSENDTSLVPWIWDLRDARDEAPSSLPNRVRALPLFDYRNKDFILGPGNKVITSLPGRLQTLTVTSNGIQFISEIPDDRLEFTPIDAWRSARNPWLYVRPDNRNSLIQVNPETGVPVEIPVGREIGTGIQAAIQGMLFGEEAQIIGQPVSRESNSLIMALLGESYRGDYAYHPLTVMLLDVLYPITPTAGSIGLLVYIRDETRGTGTIDLLRPQNANQVTIHPDGQQLMLRRAAFPGQIDVYHIASGLLEQNYYPEFGDDGTTILAYNAAGDAIISDFERFDAASGQTTYLDWHKYGGFDSFYFTQDSRALIVLAGFRWMQWDIETGTLVRQEFLNIRGDILAVSPDAQRFLTRINTPSGTGMEIVNIGQDERPFVLFETLPNREIFDIIPSPEWDNFIVIYGPNQYGQHYPGNEIALYNLYEGKKWFLAGDDLPRSMDSRSYGWVDNDTVYIYAENFDSAGSPERIYGLDYDPSGVPACLVAALPDDWQTWQPLWWRMSRVIRSDDLNRVSQEICDIVASTASAEAVNAYFTPLPTPTMIFPTPRPIVIPGVPACLTQRFSSEALQYAQDWRSITAGLSAGQIEELTKLLCEGLTGESSPQRDYGYTSNVEVITVEMATGLRSRSAYIPASDEPAAAEVDVNLVYEAFRRQFRFYPDYALLSPDKTLFAVSNYPLITIYRLAVPYEGLAATATATMEAPAATARVLQVRPTATQAADTLGGPRPTFTPTLTPTPPPTPAGDSVMFENPTIEDLCPAQLYTLANPAPGYAPPGELFIRPAQENFTPAYWRYNPVTGEQHPDETIPLCGSRQECIYSYDENWILVMGDSIRVSRPDGSDERILYRAYEQAVFPFSIYWQSPDTLEYQYKGYLPDEFLNPVQLTRRLNVATGELSEPFFPPDLSFKVNDLPAETVAIQPVTQRFLVGRLAFNTGQSIGFEYYLYDRETAQVEYLARFADEPADMAFQWHPLGHYLYYRYPNSQAWFVFNPATRQHRYLSNELPQGQWSRDARYVVYAYSLPSEEIEDRLEAGQNIPKIAVWDSDTGDTRLYCIPGTGATSFTVAYHWSPDNRYLVFQITLYRNPDADVSYPNTLILDTQTGAITDLGYDIGFISTWMGRDDAHR